MGRLDVRADVRIRRRKRIGRREAVAPLANLAVLAATGTPPAIDPAARILVSGYAAGLLPAPPGRLGVFEAAVVAALVSGGMELNSAIAAALALHALQLLLLGLLVLLATRWR